MAEMVVDRQATVWTSPLREVERAAQERAQQADIDMSTPGAMERMRAIVEEEVADWRRQYRRGQRAQDIADPEAAVERALRNLTGYGPLQPLLEDPDVWEIMIGGHRTAVPRKGAGQLQFRLTARDRK